MAAGSHSSRLSAGVSLRVNKIEKGQTKPFDEVKAKLEQELKAQLAPDQLIKLVTDFGWQL